MIYSPAFYLIFALAASVLTGLQRSAFRRHLVLAVANLLFLVLLFLWYSRYAWILCGALLVVFLGLKSMNSFKSAKDAARNALRNAMTTFLVGFVLAFLFYFNYADAYAGFLKISPIPLAVVGLAFASLRLIHLILDSGTGRIREELSLARFFNYVLFFPAYLNGPIHRFDPMIREFESAQPLDWERVAKASVRIVIGLVKMQILAFCIGHFSLNSIDEVSSQALSAWSLVLSLYCYGLWLYLSFSGATDMAIGFGLLLGVRLPENFLRPFTAVNIQEFWQRWHVSVLNWIRDYLYFPLLRVSHSRLRSAPLLGTCIVSLLCFIIFGVWHGSPLHFLAYGLYHGLGMTAFLLYSLSLKPKMERFSAATWFKLLSWFITWNFVSLGWLFFLGRQDLLAHGLKWI